MKTLLMTEHKWHALDALWQNKSSHLTTKSNLICAHIASFRSATKWRYVFIILYFPFTLFSVPFAQSVQICWIEPLLFLVHDFLLPGDACRFLFGSWCTFHTLKAYKLETKGKREICISLWEKKECYRWCLEALDGCKITCLLWDREIAQGCPSGNPFQYFLFRE